MIWPIRGPSCLRPAGHGGGSFLDRRIVVVIITASIMISSNAKAMTGNDLISKCRSKAVENEEQLVSRMQCVGYIQAIADAMKSKFGVHNVRACIPDGVDAMQEFVISYNHIYNNISTRHI